MTEYTLKVPTAMCGDAIGLVEVSEAMARYAATGYGTLPLHGPTLESLRPIYIKSLLSAARAGRLLVCNQFGFQGTVDEIIDAEKKSGDLSEIHRYLEEPSGATEIDWDMTCFLPLYVRKQHLIDWGNANGDVFNIVDAPVIVTEYGPKDENGNFAYRGMIKKDALETVHAAAKGKAAPTTSLNGDEWIVKAREFAKECLDRHKAKDLFPSQSDVCAHLEEKLRKEKIYGAHGKPVSASYIARNAIQGEWWKNNKR